MSIYLSALRHVVSSPSFSWISALVVWFMVAVGVFDGSGTVPSFWLWPALLWMLGWLAWELYSGVVRYAAAEIGKERIHEAWLGLGLALLGSCTLLLRMTGGLSSAFYPLLYLTVAFLVSFGTAKQGAFWLGYALLLEMASVLASFSSHHAAVGKGALHLVFLGLFAGTHHVYLHGLLWDIRRFRRREHALSTLETRTPENMSAQTPAGPAGLTASSMLSLHSERQSLFSSLRQGLDAHGCALLWIDEEEQSYEILHIDSLSDDIELGAFSLQLGAPASLYQQKNTICISRSGEAGIHLPYYGHSMLIRSWLAVPILQGQRLRGALCADRTKAQAFSAREQSVMEAVAILFSRALESQRSFLYGQREPEGLAQLYEAGRKLNQVHSEVELVQLGLGIATRLIPVDWGVLSLYDPEKQTHTIVATTHEVDHLIHQVLPVENTLVSLAIKHGSPLPHKGLLRTSAALMAEQDPDLPEYSSVSVLPLGIKDRVSGCLILASRDPQMFANSECEKKLGILSHHLGVLLDNMHHQRLREQTLDHDALTQVLNHRALLERLQEPFAKETRVNKRFSVLAIDIDHFQDINTQHGYDMGDHVLAQVAFVIKQNAREIDTVARFAGDEFVLLLDEASRTQALKTADRLIEQIAQLAFVTESVAHADPEQDHEELAQPETFSISVSIGVATYPDCATHPTDLLAGVHEALELAKQRGGRRAVLYSSPSSGSIQDAPSSFPKLTQPPPGWGWSSSAPLPFHSEEEIPSSMSAAEELLRIRPAFRPEAKLSVSHILEAVMQDNRNSSKDDILGVPVLLDIERKHQDLPDEPPYPQRDSEEHGYFQDGEEQEDNQHLQDSAGSLPQQQEIVSYLVEPQEAAPLDTPAPAQEKHHEPADPHFPQRPHIDGKEPDKV